LNVEWGEVFNMTHHTYTKIKIDNNVMADALKQRRGQLSDKGRYQKILVDNTHLGRIPSPWHHHSCTAANLKMTSPNSVDLLLCQSAPISANGCQMKLSLNLTLSVDVAGEHCGSVSKNNHLFVLCM
jgi:hypothetical protein